jgi:hypothetical protein
VKETNLKAIHSFIKHKLNINICSKNILKITLKKLTMFKIVIPKFILVVIFTVFTLV